MNDCPTCGFVSVSNKGVRQHHYKTHGYSLSESLRCTTHALPLDSHYRCKRCRAEAYKAQRCRACETCGQPKTEHPGGRWVCEMCRVTAWHRTRGTRPDTYLCGHPKTPENTTIGTSCLSCRRERYPEMQAYTRKWRRDMPAAQRRAMQEADRARNREMRAKAAAYDALMAQMTADLEALEASETR